MAADDQVRGLDVRILKPVLRVYALTYLGSSGQRILGSWRVFRRLDVSTRDKLQLVARILKSGLEVNRFPAAATLVIAGATAIPNFLLWIFEHVFKIGGRSLLQRLRIVCTFLSAWLAFDLLNIPSSSSTKQIGDANTANANNANAANTSNSKLASQGPPSKYAGKTIGLTLFAACRALDVLAVSAWTKTRSKKWHPEVLSPRLAQLVKSMAETWIFVGANTIIMYAWFYSPQRLPRAYQEWLSSAAELDPRLLEVLRLCRQGDFVYGQDTGQAAVLEPVCDKYGFPRKWADPAKTIPIPCELYHCGVGKSCEVHALSRWCRGFIFAFRMYLPLQLLVRIQRLSPKGLVAALRGATRHSAFLATFIMLFYYSVCLSRTRLGPKLFSSQTVTPQMWDSGLAVMSGCLTCGWSILVLPPSQRHEFAFFVAPRALATLMPEVYDRKHQRREQIVFATSVTVVLAAAASAASATGTNQAIRGVFGGVLNKLLQE